MTMRLRKDQPVGSGDKKSGTPSGHVHDRYGRDMGSDRLIGTIRKEIRSR